MLEVYTLFDRRMREFGALVTAQNEDTARRMVGDGLRQDSLVSRYPGDYDLYQLGVYDERTGLIERHASPVLVATVDEIRLQFKNGGV